MEGESSKEEEKLLRYEKEGRQAERAAYKPERSQRRVEVSSSGEMAGLVQQRRYPVEEYSHNSAC